MLVVIVVNLTEFTTMAGRRLRDAMKTVLSADKSLGSNVHIVIAGLTNT
jgi:neutral ceramidase